MNSLTFSGGIWQDWLKGQVIGANLVASVLNLSNLDLFFKAKLYKSPRYILIVLGGLGGGFRSCNIKRCRLKNLPGRWGRKLPEKVSAT